MERVGSLQTASPFFCAHLGGCLGQRQYIPMMDTVAPTSEQPAMTVGLLLDQVMRQVAAMNLGDFFLGSKVNHADQKVWVFFSDNMPKDALKPLEDDLNGAEMSVKVSETDEEGAAWMLVASPANTLGPEPVGITGQVGMDIQLDGTVDVK